MAYPTDWTPAYSHNSASGTGVGAAIDISGAVVSGLPPVMIVTFTGTATYVIQGSHDGTNWVDFSSSLTAAAAKDLVPGVRFWRTKINANSALFTSAVGAVPGADGRYVQPAVKSGFVAPTF